MQQHWSYADQAQRFANARQGDMAITAALLAIYHLLDARLPRQNPLDAPPGHSSNRPPEPHESISTDA